MENLTAEARANAVIDITSGDLFPILEAIDQGILIADKNGYILFYNRSHAIMDGLHHDSVKGRKITDVYDHDEKSSLVMRCLGKGKPIVNLTHIYTARNGRVVNSINNVFPLKKNGQLIGAISFVKDYEYLDGIINQIDGTYKKAPITNETRYTFNCIIGATPPISAMVNKAKLAANSPSPIMLYGETGTGKELFAQSIHNYSHRKKASYMAVNCAAIPESLLEGILFGSTRGAFTGAMEKPGLFEQANGGTVFLDEMNSMPIGLQGKLLRVLQEKKVRRIGATKEIVLDLKIISSSNVLPQEAITAGDMRRDLFYRLSVVFLAIPPLRERKDDIELLTGHFIHKHNKLMNKNVSRISPGMAGFFENYPWPGNVRELENLIEGAMNMVGNEREIRRVHLASEALCHEHGCNLSTDAPAPLPSSGSPIRPSGYPQPPSVEPGGGVHARSEPAASRGTFHDNTDDGEKELIVAALTASRGNVKKAALQLKISRQTLHKKIKKHAVDKAKILSDIEKGAIEEQLLEAGGSVTVAAERLSISRQLLNYKIKKYNISKNRYRHQAG